MFVRFKVISYKFSYFFKVVKGSLGDGPQPTQCLPVSQNTMFSYFQIKLTCTYDKKREQEFVSLKL